MMTTTTRTRSTYAPTYHRDGTVTYWSVYMQQWIRATASAIYDDDATMASQGETFRRRVARMAATHAEGSN